MKLNLDCESNWVKFLIVLGFAVMSYVIYILTVGIHEDYRIDREIETFKVEIEALEAANKKIQVETDYVKSDAYKEVFAKQTLGLINPGEELIVIKKDDQGGENDFDVVADDYQNKEHVSAAENVRMWWDFVFAKEALY